jgi:hypothetical protein
MSLALRRNRKQRRNERASGRARKQRRSPRRRDRNWHIWASVWRSWDSLVWLYKNIPGRLWMNRISRGVHRAGRFKGWHFAAISKRFFCIFIYTALKAFKAFRDKRKTNHPFYSIYFDFPNISLSLQPRPGGPGQPRLKLLTQISLTVQPRPQANPSLCRYFHPTFSPTISLHPIPTNPFISSHSIRLPHLPFPAYRRKAALRAYASAASSNPTGAPS